MIYNKQPTWVELFVVDGHGEYDIPEIEGGARLDEMWDGNNVSAIVGEAPTQAFYEAHFPDALKKWGFGAYDYIWRLYGTIEQIERTYDAFVAKISGGPVGGDDDYFDYWPSAVMMAKQIAIDLDELTGGRRERVLRAGIEALNVDEFMWGD